MRLLIDAKDLVNVNLKKLAGLDVTVVGYENIDNTLVNKLKEVADEVIVEELRNKMQMITYIRLQLMDSAKVFFSTEKNVLAMLCRKNCANDLELTLAYIMGKIKLDKLKGKVDKTTNEETEEVEKAEEVNDAKDCIIVDFEEKKEEKTEQEINNEETLRAKLDRVRAFREAK